MRNAVPLTCTNASLFALSAPSSKEMPTTPFVSNHPHLRRVAAAREIGPRDNSASRKVEVAYARLVLKKCLAACQKNFVNAGVSVGWKVVQKFSIEKILGEGARMHCSYSNCF